MLGKPRRRKKTHAATAAITRLITAVRQLSGAATLDDVAAVVKRAARQLVAADGATFVLREEGPEELCHYVEEDAIAPLWKGRKFPMSTCVSGWSMLYRQQAIIPDIYADERIPHDVYRPTFVRSLVMTPVRTLRPWAAIGVYWARPYTPTAEQVGWLQSLADSTSVAMENVRILAQMEVLNAWELPGAAAERRRASDQPQPPVRMCAWTRRFELDGQWISVEEYLQRRFGLQVSHGISDEAVAMLESRRRPKDPPTTEIA